MRAPRPERLAALDAPSPPGSGLTISAGFAQTTADVTIADALALADRRMYAEKQAHRTARTAG